MTHWQSPRFFAYFAATASEPGILAELLAATLNQVGFIWRTSPASTELEALTLDWTAQLLGLPSGWHGHIEDSGSVSTLAALAAGREHSGGRVVVCSEEAHSSVELAHACNAHKWLFTPMDCSLLWTQRPEALRAAFSLVPEYLRTPDEAESLSDYGPALGRRFRALKLWTVLRCYGRQGLQARIRETIRLAELFESWVGEDPRWELCAPRPLSVVCFRWAGTDEENEAIVERVNRSGELFLSHTRLNSRYVIRLAVGNERTTEEDVRRAWAGIRAVAATFA